MMKKETIEEIVDRALDFWIENEINQLPCDIEEEMLAPDQPDEEWKFWLPVKSKVTDAELQEFEAETGFVFPEDFKTFLKYKHFYELQISEVSFCSHPVNVWRASLREMMFDTYPREFLFDKGYVPLPYTATGECCALIPITKTLSYAGIMKMPKTLNTDTKISMNCSLKFQKNKLSCLFRICRFGFH